MKQVRHIILHIAVLLNSCPTALSQDVIRSDFAGTNLAARTPWTATTFLAPQVAATGWQLGPGLVPLDGNDALIVMPNSSSNESTLAEDLAAGNYFSLTLSATNGATELDLGRKKMSFTVCRPDYYSPRQFYLFTSLDGFSGSEPVFSSSLYIEEHSGAVELEILLPDRFNGLTEPIELRIVCARSRYGHAVALKQFALIEPEPLVELHITSSAGGTVRLDPDGSLFEIGTVVTLVPFPDVGHHFNGWTGDVSGPSVPLRLELTQAVLQVEARFAPNPTNQMAVGQNLSPIVDYSTAWVFVDMMKMGRDWLSREVTRPEQWESGLIPPVDLQGWPLEVPFVGSNTDLHIVHTLIPSFVTGQYSITWNGTGRFRLLNDVHQEFAGTDGTGSFEVGSTEFGSRLEILESNPSNPLRNLSVVMPGFADTHRAQPFHPAYLARLQNLKVLRFMDWGRTNGSPVERWEDRTPPDYWTQAHSNGVALEIMCDLANTTGIDAWICIPHQADDHYIQETAHVIAQHLDPLRKIYVEYSNETWNEAGDFTQTPWIQAEGLALGLDTDRIAAANKFTTHRSAEIWQAFEQTFGDDSACRLVNVLAGWSGGVDSTRQRVESAYDPEVNPTGVIPDAIAIAPYFGHVYTNTNVVVYPTVDQLVGPVSQQLIEEARTQVQAHKRLVDGYGLPLVCYEGGQHFAGIFGVENDDRFTEIFHATNRDPRMEADTQNISICFKPKGLS